MTRLWHLILALKILPSLFLYSRQRYLWLEMQAFLRHLPAVLGAPLPVALASITPPAHNRLPSGLLPTGEGRGGGSTRRLADLAALVDRRSPLGLCLRRSLVRYHFLRRAGIPVVLHFGARFKDGRPDREVTGHAWLTLDGEPYFEEGENYMGFTVMLQYPSDV